MLWFYGWPNDVEHYSNYYMSLKEGTGLKTEASGSWGLTSPSSHDYSMRSWENHRLNQRRRVHPNPNQYQTIWVSAWYLRILEPQNHPDHKQPKTSWTPPWRFALPTFTIFHPIRCRNPSFCCRLSGQNAVLRNSDLSPRAMLEIRVWV